MNIRKILISDLTFHTGGFRDFTDFIIEKTTPRNNDKIIIVHVNLRNYYYLHKTEKLKDDIKKNCICVFDGIGMKAGVMMRGYGILPDLNGTDLFPLLMKEFVSSKYGIFLLGADSNAINLAAKKIRKEYPGIDLRGYHGGYFSAAEEDSVIETINQSKSDILIIGRGFPLQEQFVLKHKDRLRVSLIWNVGGLFDILSGIKPRAPELMRKIRLEWLYRFSLEPGRMLHRNTVAAVWSFLHILLNAKGVTQ